ncbi:MAG TPA: FAD-binding oxidoreductase, partial [Steroidobacteraceae bacterium]|nr:FAD-binding oxidoreductase [Steroidobacteraceae bacterium]
MGREDTVDSYYAASAHPAPERRALEGAVDCDVCVVGGGIAGCSAALHLAERGLSVVLLEGHRIGWGASGRSGGQALFGVAAPQAKLERLLGASDARAVWDVSVEALTLLRSLLARFRIDCDWRDGYLLTAVKPRHVAELKDEVRELTGRYGYRSVRYVERAELRTQLATTRYLGALYDANSGHLHPLNYTQGVARAAESFGVRIFEDSRALSYEPAAAGRVQVTTARGTVRARQLVLCGNVYLGKLVPALAAKIMGVATYIVATEPLGEARARELVPGNAATCDMNWVLDYFRRSA